MRAWKVGLALFVSAGAFAGLWVFGTMDLVSEAAAADSVSIEPEPPLEVGAAAAPDDPLELVMPDEMDAPDEVPSGVQVPDLSDTTALRAFRRGRELGFVIDVRDEDGDRVPASERLYMRVLDEGQDPAAGSFAEPGSTVRVVARYPGGARGMGYASGY